MGEGVQPGQRETSSFGTTAATSCSFFFFIILRLTPLVFFFLFFFLTFCSSHSIMSLLSILFIIISGQFTFCVVMMGRSGVATSSRTQSAKLLAVQLPFFFYFGLIFFPFCAIMFFPRGGWESSVYLSCKVIFILFIFGFFFFLIGFTAPFPRQRCVSVAVCVC